MTPGEFRLRVTYAKTGRLRHLSHLEVLHTIERTIRRAGLSYAVTQGFSPHMKIAFGPALPVGTAGDRECYDVWLTRYTEASEALGALMAVAPSDLAPFEAHYVAGNAPSLTAALTIAMYRCEVFGEEIDSTNVHAALTNLLQSGELAVEHKGKHKVFDLTRAVPKDPRVTVGDGGAIVIEFPVRIGPEGSLRPEMLIRAALREADIEVSAVHTTRTDALVEDDEGVWSRPV